MTDTPKDTRYGLQIKQGNITRNTMHHTSHMYSRLTTLGLVDQPYLRAGVLLGHYVIQLLLEEGSKTSPISGIRRSTLRRQDTAVARGILRGHLEQTLVGGEYACIFVVVRAGVVVGHYYCRTEKTSSVCWWRRRKTRKEGGFVKDQESDAGGQQNRGGSCTRSSSGDG